MAYNAIDLIDKVISISKKVLILYEKAIEDNDKSNSFVVGIFIKHRIKRIDFYNSLKEEMKNVEINEINFFMYDKVSSLISEFNNKIKLNWNGDKKEFIKWILNFNKDIIALFIDIRGRLTQNSEQYKNVEYQVLTTIIDMEHKYIDEIESIYNKIN